MKKLVIVLLLIASNAYAGTATIQGVQQTAGPGAFNVQVACDDGAGKVVNAQVSVQNPPDKLYVLTAIRDVCKQVLQGEKSKDQMNNAIGQTVTF